MKALLYEEEVLKQFKKELTKASQFHIGTALITKGGIEQIYASIDNCLRKGGQGAVLIGTDLPTEPDAIERLCTLRAQYKESLKLRRFQSGKRFFHPKLTVFFEGSRAKTAIFGSSNLTQGGLTENYEANILLDDPRIVQALFDYFEEHFQGAHSREVDPTWLREYKRLWTERKRVNDRLQQLREKARTLRPPTQKIPSRIRGYCFAFTGKIPDWPRNAKLYPCVRRYGGQVAETARAIDHANCLVHAEILGGRESTEKLKRARKSNIPVTTEEDFFKVLNNEKRLRRH